MKAAFQFAIVESNWSKKNITTCPRHQQCNKRNVMNFYLHMIIIGTVNHFLSMYLTIIDRTNISADIRGFWWITPPDFGVIFFFL